MISIHKINPMARAIGTMGVVAAVVGGITFAQTGLTSQTVALSPNNLSTATAGLYIAAGNTCNGEGGSGDTTATTGLQDSSLIPGGSAATVSFCLDNTGGVPLNVTASIPQVPISGVAASDTTLTVTCNTEGTLSATLSNWGPGTFSTPILAGTYDNCTASAALSNSYTGVGGDVIPQFDINFIGNQST